jgi:hypothetical protein
VRGWLQHLPRLCISSKGISASISASISVSSISNREAIAQQFLCVSMLRTERAKSESLISSMTAQEGLPTTTLAPPGHKA